jgi:2-aminophenol/2-amino-5-chlorophenol 1,6-dioxygenase subunit beta
MSKAKPNKNEDNQLAQGAGKIVAGALAPHPPHLVYAENPPQNEPKAECGWETLRWGYESLRESIKDLDYDTIVVLSPHWRTYVGTHILAVPHMKSISVDPVFPHLFRFHYDMKVDVDLAENIFESFNEAGLVTKKMTNPDFRVDYGTIVSCHMVNPKWDKPIVALSSHAASAYFSPDVMQEESVQLGAATKTAITKSGKKVLMLASNSLSHRHFTREPAIPEDMSKEHIYHHGQYLWDMKVIELMKQGKIKEFMNIMPDFTEQAVSETDGGALTWMLSAMDYPNYPAKIHGYGTVIGTGNAIISWRPVSLRPDAASGAKTQQAGAI